VQRLENFSSIFYDEENCSNKNEAGAKPKGLGIYINVNVENIDTYYQSLLDKGLKPSSIPVTGLGGIGNLLFVTQTGISWFSAKS